MRSPSHSQLRSDWQMRNKSMNLYSDQLFLILTNSHATTQLSTTATSETVLPDINVPFNTHFFNFVVYYRQKGFL